MRREKEGKMYKVIVDIAPRTIEGTNGCHKYVFNSYKRKKEAVSEMNKINQIKELGVATVEKSKI